MYFVEDTRQKRDKHLQKNDYWRVNGHKVLRCKLPFGDYAPPPSVAVDTKENMAEIANNIGTYSEHIRFREECKLAQLYGCKLIILIENDDGIGTLEDVQNWKNPRKKHSPKCIDGQQLYKSMMTMQYRYGVEFQFCTPEEAGQRVIDILGGQYEQG